MLKQLGIDKSEIWTMKYTFPVILTEDLDDGGYVVTCRDLPEAITQGDTIGQALTAAADALDEAICGCINRGRDIPEPSAEQAGERLVSVPVTTALKAAAYTKFRESGQTKVAIAKALDLKESEVRRILDPRHGTKATTLEQFIRSLGGDVLVSAG